MLKKETLQFLKNLKKNNDRVWFEKNKEKYLAAKEDFEGFVAQLLKELAKINPALSTLEAKKITFRIYKDVRFSKDKSPYKVNMGAYFKPGDKKVDGAGFYFHLEPNGKSFMGGGRYYPDADHLRKIRQEIDYNLPEFEKIIKSKSFVKTYKGLETANYSLQRPPKGYEADNKAIAYLKLTSILATIAVSDELIQSNKLISECAKAYRSIYPLLQFLHRAVE